MNAQLVLHELWAGGSSHRNTLKVRRGVGTVSNQPHYQSIKEKNISPEQARAEAASAMESFSLGFPSLLSIIQNRQAAGRTDGDATARVHMERHRSGQLSG